MLSDFMSEYSGLRLLLGRDFAKKSWGNIPYKAAANPMLAALPSLNPHPAAGRHSGFVLTL